MRDALILSLGLGFLAGSLEALATSAASRLPLMVSEYFVFSLVNIGVVGVFSVLCGLALAPWLWLRSSPLSLVGSEHLAGVGGLLAGLYLWQDSLLLLSQQRTGAAMTIGLVPVAFTGVVYFNARFWLRRAERSSTPAVGWLPISLGASLVIGALASVAQAQRPFGGVGGLDDDKSVLLISATGLEADTLRSMSFFDQGIFFSDGISPTPHLTSSVAAMLTGRHPLRNGVLREGDPLNPAYHTSAESFAEEGYRTGAFVGRGLSSLGLSQGFYRFDDALDPWGLGLNHIVLVRLLLPFHVQQRSDDSLLGRYYRWMTQVSGPRFSWIHLEEPAPALVKRSIESLWIDLERRGQREQTVVLIVRLPSEQRPLPFNHRVLAEEQIDAPMWVSSPAAVLSEVVEPVSIIDLFPTLLEAVGFDPYPQAEGVEVLSYSKSEPHPASGSSLLGWDAHGNAWVGLRFEGVKYIQSLNGDERWLYDLQSDPVERHNLIDSNGEAASQARAQLASEIHTLRAIVSQ